MEIRKKQVFKPDLRVITLEKICEVAMKQKMDLTKKRKKKISESIFLLI